MMTWSIMVLNARQEFEDYLAQPGLTEIQRAARWFIITGKVQNDQGVIHVMAAEIAELPNLGLPTQASHDFR